ncbi:MAG TPA: YbhN family protein [Acidimicrobiales bacterium]|jgi:hypothetical protein
MASSKDQPRRRPAWLPSPGILVGALVLAGLVVLVVREQSIWHQVDSVVTHFRITRLPWLALALGAEAASFVCYALVQRALLADGGAELSRLDMIKLAVAATGLTNLLPGGTAPASGWLVAQYRKRGIPMPLALWAVLAGGFAATVSVLTLTLLGAAIADLLPIWAAALCAVALAAGGVAVVAGFHQLRTLRAWTDRHHFGPFNRVLTEAGKRVGEASTFRAGSASGTRILALSLGNWGLDVACLITAFAVLGLPVPWRTVVFAYAVAQVAGSLAPVPGGIGFVEGGMVGAFALAGTPVGGAILATVVYRVITTLGVAGLGSLMLLHLSRQKRTRHARLSGKAKALTKQ